MVHQAVELLDPGSEDRVLDLYCGIGNFSLPLARRAGEVLGVEGDAMLVKAAAANAELNGINNAEFRQANLSAIDGSEAWLREGWDLLLLDPARSGAQEIVEHMCPAIRGRWRATQVRWSMKRVTRASRRVLLTCSRTRRMLSLLPYLISNFNSLLRFYRISICLSDR